ncbi:hypothetical protein D3C72_1360970 [compost metagenome]
MLQFTERAREHVAPVGGGVAARVVVEAAAALQAQPPFLDHAPDDGRRGVAARIERGRHLAARVVQDVAAAEVDELDHAERREAQAQAVARGLVDFFRCGSAFFDHAGRLVHHERLQARHDVAGRRAADHGQLADGLHQCLGACEHAGVGAGVAAQLDHGNHVGRVEPVHVQEALGPAHQRGQLRHEDAAGGRGEDRVVAAMAVEVLEGLALGLHGFGHAFEHQLGGGQRARCFCCVHEIHARGDALDLRGIDHTELRKA